MDLEHNVKSFPRRPGVYLFKDDDGEVIYVGKAVRLRDRVKNYFGTSHDERRQVAFLMKRVRDIEYIVTDTEKEALLLENTLIKKHQPRYNIHLKDDKTFLSIRMGMEHPSPGISVTRHPKKDGARYFGPYASGLACREVTDEIVRFFKIRSCSDREFANRVRPCLLFDIGRCAGPCVGNVDEDSYRGQIAEAIMFLEGKRKELVVLFRKRMKDASEHQRYEEAARYRDLVQGIEGMIEKQKVVTHGAGDRDVVGLASDAKTLAACVLNVRSGTLSGKRVEMLGRPSDDEEVTLETFLLQWYSGFRDVPTEILLPRKIEGTKALTEILREKRGARVKITVPHKGDRLGLVHLAQDNAREALRLHRDTSEAMVSSLEKLKSKLMLPNTPDLIECLDISNIQGRDAYGSLVTFVTGEPDKSQYRLYRIQTVEKPDDYRMMREVLERRFRGHRPPPDLLLIDGGKGQLNVAVKALRDLGIDDVPVASIAKGVSKGREVDDIYVPGRKNPLTFRRGSKELLLLMRMRDEAHRFGIKAHRQRRIKQLTS